MSSSALLSYSHDQFQFLLMTSAPLILLLLSIGVLILELGTVKSETSSFSRPIQGVEIKVKSKIM